MTAFDLRALRDAFGCFMTGVTIITTFDEEGQPLGFTANSFTSVSLDPPLLLISIARTSRNYQNFAKARDFAINILSEGQREASATFARPVEDRFASVEWRKGPHGSPVIAGVSAWFDCSVHQLVEAGDHAILIGRVEAFEATQEPGLGYYRGAYVTPAQIGAQMPAGPDVIVSVIVEAAGSVLLIDDGEGGLSLPEMQAGRDGLQGALTRLLAAAGVDAAPGEIYAVYDNAAQSRQHIAFRCPAANTQASQGRFVPLRHDNLDAVRDPAIRSMLERLAEESRVRNYGVYFGTHETGRVTSNRERIAP